ncbi:MAG: chloride channel protein [Planctomycetes bacterium]|nr:chloride channel protein [Planctomycetota bacterium]
MRKRLDMLGRQARRRVVGFFSKHGFREEYFLTLMAILIGVATGCGASGFFLLIEEANAFAYGHGEQAGGLFGGRLWMLVLLPAVGALLVGLMTYYWAAEAKGHGVPEVMDAIYRRDGVIRPRVAIVKAVASALTIGSGGSAGTEGPIIQIGAAIGSGFGQWLKVHRRQMGVLVACGAAAGIASIFNAPIAGVLFALEIFLRDFSFRSFSPVVFSSVLSCSTTHYLQSKFAKEGAEIDLAIFNVERIGYDFIGTELFYYLMLGSLCAVVGVAFIRLLYWSEDVFDKLNLYGPLKPVLGAVGLGVTGALYCLITNQHVQPEFFGNGYPMIEIAVSNELLTRYTGYAGIGLLLVFAVLKLVATCLTLGSGGSGGVLAPSLMLGAMVGGAFGLLLKQFGWVEDTSVTAYALVGMAAMVAATTHASLTAIVILFEMTRDYKVILPIMFAAIVSTAGAKMLLTDSIYTLKLRRRGVQMGTLADLTLLRRLTAEQVPRVKAQFVHPEDPLQKLIDLAGQSEWSDFVVVDDQDDYLGMVTSQDIRTALLQPEAVPLLLVGELLRPEIPTVTPHESLDAVLEKFSRSDCAALPITALDNEEEITGLITRQGVMTMYREELDKHVE